MKKILFLFAAAALLISCDPKPPGGGDDNGKTDPATIAAADLITYFSFDADFKDAKGLEPTNAATTKSTIFDDGQRGKCYLGAADGGGLIYELPATHALKTLQSFTFSMWVRLEANTASTLPTAPHDPEQMIFQLDADPDNDWIWGNFFFLQHRNFVETTNDPWTISNAPMDCFFWKEDASYTQNDSIKTGWRGQRGDGWAIDLSAPVWHHVICSYDQASSEFHAYVDGKHVVSHLNNDKDGDGKVDHRDTTVYNGVKRSQYDPTLGGQPLGALKFKDAKNFVIGAWSEKIKGEALTTDNWAAAFRGRLDEFRIYKRGLTEQEAKDLYNAELSQVEE